ncbi:hypothetical protein BD410DRAFT_830241 [Rickenella mellea]|uniref:Lanthionine synthetase C family protein n=1 Tax=Rickenella mellea TaxID=50990 RepID=A0A4Y7PYK8_9AGAM|nr:hypothetical protein BD410DRAFT_830241 [Rickenella mellea]
MSSNRRYLSHLLEPIALDEENLRTVLSAFQAAILSAIKQIEDHTSRSASDKHDSLYTGDSGVSLLFLRLVLQSNAAGLPDDVKNSLQALIRTHLPPLAEYQPVPGYLSPLETPVGPALVEVFTDLVYPPGSAAVWKTSLTTVKNSIRVASHDFHTGGDEVLYGRAGMLWGMLNLVRWADRNSKEPDQVRRLELASIVDAHTLSKVIGRIIDIGKAGSTAFIRKEGSEESLPLMWEWHGKYYLGAIHGVAGILTVLLQAPHTLIAPHLPIIISTVSALVLLAERNNGHLPSSLPARNKNPLVQICHGSPGLLILLATIRTRHPTHCSDNWDNAEQMACRVVWQEGLLRKGLGVCHGASGNAWSLLLFAHARRGTTIGDKALARALAFLLQAMHMPPLTLIKPVNQSPYCTPDHPYSLFEGIAGVVCAWADACVVIQDRLTRIGGGKPEKRELREPVLGIPGLGGMGAGGVL